MTTLSLVLAAAWVVLAALSLGMAVVVGRISRLEHRCRKLKATVLEHERRLQEE